MQPLFVDSVRVLNLKDNINDLAIALMASATKTLVNSKGGLPNKNVIESDYSKLDNHLIRFKSSTATAYAAMDEALIEKLSSASGSLLARIMQFKDTDKWALLSGHFNI